MFSRTLRAAALRTSPAVARIPQRPASLVQLARSTQYTQPRWMSTSARWYSDAAPEKAEAPKEAEAAQPAADVEALKKDLEAKTKEVVDLKDKYLRQVADYRNLQDRTKRESQAAKDFALQKFAKDLIMSMDNLEHALRSIPAEKVGAAPAADASVESLHKDLVNLHQGLQMTETVLLDTLKRHGVVRTDPALEAEKFDPNVHEATFMAPQPDKEDGTIFHTQTKGFLLNGRVLRAAQVGVVKNS